MPLLLPFLHRARRLALRLLNWPTRGVKVMVFDPQGALLLVRNTYGDRDAFLLPGGGIGRGEAPAAAAAREIMEETGLALRDMAARSVHRARHEGRRDTVHLFTARSDGVPEPDGVEVAEARFFALDALPPTVSAATRRRIDEYRGAQPADGRW